MLNSFNPSGRYAFNSPLILYQPASHVLIWCFRCSCPKCFFHLNEEATRSFALSNTTCDKFGDWRNRRKYYSTILFFIMSNVVCILLIYNHTLWQYETKILNHTFCALFICITVYPNIVMLFIPNFQRK